LTIVGERVAASSNIIDLERHHIAAAELAINRQVKQCEVADATFDLKLRPNGPDMLGAERRFAPMIFPLFQGTRVEVSVVMQGSVI
jgi:hypothetical protein